jgi:hypothetical protein
MCFATRSPGRAAPVRAAGKERKKSVNDSSPSTAYLTLPVLASRKSEKGLVRRGPWRFHSTGTLRQILFSCKHSGNAPAVCFYKVEATAFENL